MRANVGIDYHAKAQANIARAGYRDIDAGPLAHFERCAPFTMTTTERMNALYEACLNVWRNKIPGAIVETGVWRGGSMMVAALALQHAGDEAREIWGYDTFEGLPEPAAFEADIWGGNQLDAWRAHHRDGIYQGYRTTWGEVVINVAGTGFPQERIRCVMGKVEDTIPAKAPAEIAVLRIDTDWHASIAHTLEHLYPRLSSGGVLIVDDYGHLSGARLAVDEYLARLERAPLLVRVDYSCRLAVKP